MMTATTGAVARGSAETWTAAQRRKNRVLRWLVGALLVVADRSPKRLLRAAGRALGLVTWLAARRLRQRAQSRLAKLFPEAEARGLARRAFDRAGQSLALSLLARRPRVAAEDVVSISSEARTLLSTRRGAVVVSAHLGPFEWIAPAVSELGLPTAVVVRESYDPELDPLVDHHRTLRGVEVIHRGRAGSGLAILRALRRGKLVGLLPDLPSSVPSLEVELAGERTPVARGPAELALRAGVPLLVATLRERPGRPGFELDVVELETTGVDGDELTHRVARELSAAILRSPAWWLWMTPARASELRKNPPTG